MCLTLLSYNSKQLRQQLRFHPPLAQPQLQQQTERPSLYRQLLQMTQIAPATQDNNTQRVQLGHSKLRRTSTQLKHLQQTPEPLPDRSLHWNQLFQVCSLHLAQPHLFFKMHSLSYRHTNIRLYLDNAPFLRLFVLDANTNAPTNAQLKPHGNYSTQHLRPIYQTLIPHLQFLKHSLLLLFKELQLPPTHLQQHLISSLNDHLPTSRAL